jgi:transcriptional regulator with XRE-family HTH domain
LANEHLRTAITRAGLSLEEFGDIVGVDVRTVRRWIAGGTPFPRLRISAASALETTEHALWPGAVTPPAEPPEPEPPTPSALTDEIGGYPQARGTAAPNVRELLSSASSRVELIVASNGDGEDLTRLLRAAVATGLPVRVIIGAPVHAAEPLFDIDTIEMRASATREENVLLCADDQMLLVLISMRSVKDAAPVIHLRRRVDGGLFDRLVDEFDAKWLQAAQLTSPEQLAVSLAGTELASDADFVQDDILPSEEPARPPEASTERPRRWPRRGT